MNIASSQVETAFASRIITNQRCMRLIKSSLTNIINKLITKINFDKTSFFSNNIYWFGNIGIPTNEFELQRNLDYILSTNSTIREKMTAIANSLIDKADPQKKNDKNTIILFEYMNTLYDSQKANPWIIQRIEYVRAITETKTNEAFEIPYQKQFDSSLNQMHIKPLLNQMSHQLYINPLFDLIFHQTQNVQSLDWKFNRIIQSDLSLDQDQQKIRQLNVHEKHTIQINDGHKWAPINIIYKSYRNKCELTWNQLKTDDSFVPEINGISSDELIEPLSDLEQYFFMNIPCSTNRLCCVPGKYIYSDIKYLLPESKDRSENLIVGGISGHTLLFMELSLILGVRWEPVLFGCIVSQYPLHHSLIEIVDALIEMGLVPPLSGNTSQIDVLNQLASSMNIMI